MVPGSDKVTPMLVEELNDTNCKSYLLVAGRVAALVDPVRERLDTYREVIAKSGLTLAFVVETHTHADHFMLGHAARSALGVPVVMHRASPSPFVERYVEDGERLPLHDQTIEILHTPGHTKDSICLRVPGAVLTGDTLLIGGSGRTDFPGGDAGEQYDAVTARLFGLPDETIVWPGHDYKGRRSSTIGEERRANSRFAGKTRADYQRLMQDLGLPLPDRAREALQVNQSGFGADAVAFPPIPELNELRVLTARDLGARLGSAEPPLLLDVREPEEFVGELGHIAGALLVPLDALAGRMPKLVGYVEREVVVVCRAGARSATAAAILARAGFARIFNLEGGMLAWTAERLPIQR
jgi:glyoxylase-like metal-dependent hydrolase (beta-lactamase superfamily II)/rhodanese-related sulfurtransferase